MCDFQALDVLSFWSGYDPGGTVIDDGASISLGLFLSDHVEYILW